MSYPQGGGYPGYGAPQGGYPGYGAPPGAQPGYGAPPGAQPGYGAPPGAQPGYGGYPGYGAPPGAQPGYGAPPGAQPGYGAPPGAQPGYGAPPGAQPGYGAPPGAYPGYGAPPGAQPGYGAPPGAHPGAGAPGGPGGPGGAHNYTSANWQPDQSQLQGWGGQMYNQLGPQQVAEMRGWFASLDKDRSGSITAQELSTAQFGGQKLSLVTAKMLVAVFDTDKSGNIGFFEYCVLHKFITGMQTSFFMYDKDGSGRLDKREVHDALANGGFQLSQPLVDQIFTKFYKRPGLGASSANTEGLDFECFIQMCAYLGQLRSTFEVQDTDRDGWIRVNLEGLIQLSTCMPSLPSAV